jgi:hypothetical protein
MTKKWKIALIIVGALIIAGNIRLVVFLWNVNRDLDHCCYQIYALQKEAARLETIQSTMISKAETQRILDRQTAYYRSQLNDLAGEVNGYSYQQNQNNLKAYLADPQNQDKQRAYYGY